MVETLAIFPATTHLPIQSTSSRTGQLIHAKYMREICSLLMHIPIYYNVISFFFET
jgi:hypothetical protein